MTTQSSQPAVSTPDPAILPVRVWVLPPQAVGDSTGSASDRNAYIFPWSLGSSPGPNFVEELRLIPERSTEAPCAMGDASFRLLRALREENGITVNDFGKVVAGAYVCITAGMGPVKTDTTAPPAFDSSAGGLAKVLWWGWISSIDATQIAGTIDLMGSVSARELGHLLDGTVLTGFSKNVASGYATSISAPPTANFSVVECQVIGNAIISSKNGGSQFASVYAFAPLPAQCGTATSNLWTRWRLLLHVLAFCVPPHFPSLLIACADGSAAADPTGATISGYLNDTSVPEVFDLRDLTLKGALDMLIPRSRGFGWKLKPTSATAWTITIFTYDADGKYAVANAPTDIDLSALKDIKTVAVATSTDEDYDEVVVQGEPIVVAGTVGFPDGNLKEGWTQPPATNDQETVFLDGAKNETGDSGYATWNPPTKKILRNNQIRQTPLLERVFTTYRLHANNGEDVQKSNPPGDGTGSKESLIPTVSWDATKKVTSISKSPSRVPYLPTARILRNIPWPVGVKSDGTDTRDPIQKSNPDYWTPRVFRYLSPGPSWEPHTWVDLLIKNGNSQDVSSLRGSPAVSPDDRSPALRVAFSPAEMLAKKQWLGSPGISSLSPDPSTNQLCLDYTSLVFTIALQSDQRVEVVATKPGLSPGSPGSPSSQARRRLVIRDSRLHCWIMPLQTIIGVKSDGTPDRVTNSGTSYALDGNGYGVLIRNDYPLAQKILDMTSAWAFQRRSSISITRARPDQTPAWASIGYMIGNLIEVQANGASRAQIPTVANTVVERIERDYSVGGPSMTISTSLPARPDTTWRIGGGSPSPTAGGAVSVAGGGTLAQQVQDVKQTATQLVSDARRVPLILPFVPSTVAFQTILIDQGNVLASGQNGVKYIATVASVPSAYDPTVTSSFIDGIGRGTLYIDGVSQGYVLVANTSSGSIGSIALLTGDTIAVASVGSIANAGAGAASVVVYFPAWL